MTPQTPRILEGAGADRRDEQSRRVHASATTGSQADRLEALYRTGSADVVHAAGGEMFEAVKILKAANPQQYSPQNGAEYPRSQFGQHLRQIAQLIKADVGLEIAFADVGGWDTHVNQGAATGQLANRLDDFAQSIAALVADLGDRMARRHDPHDVGVRPHGAPERQRRHGSRPRDARCSSSAAT